MNDTEIYNSSMGENGERINSISVSDKWKEDGQAWSSESNQWEDVAYVKYTESTQNTLLSSGEYLILANSQPFRDVQKILRIDETIMDSGVGTILKKEFRYSIDSTTFSEFQDMNTASLGSIGPFDRVWFQFRYILLSGGPVSISKAVPIYDGIVRDPFDGYVAPNIKDESKVYAFPVSYKSNFLWDPYKMNRAVRLYKDLNLMVNNLFGHDVNYYRVLPQGRSKDVFLMEYSLYEHDEGRCLKAVVPNNEFPDNKLNMGPFGVDFELPFEIHMDKDYFQKIFGDGSGPQKRDVLYFPRTNRIYEVSSSYLFRDFMNEPLYFKISLIKWLPKTNVEQSDSVNTLESYTVSAGGLFGDLIQQEENKITNPEQFNVAYENADPVRDQLILEQTIGDENVTNYYTMIAEHYYQMESTINFKKIRVQIDSSNLDKGSTYFCRLAPDSTQADVQYYYSMKKVTYEGVDEDGYSVFTSDSGKSQFESQYHVSDIFSSSSLFSLFEREYTGSLDENVISCNVPPAELYIPKNVKYRAVNNFSPDEDRSFSAWFRLKANPNPKLQVSSMSLDIYTRELTITLSKPYLPGFLLGEMLTFTRKSGTGFFIYGEISSINSVSVTLKVDQEILDFVKGNFSNWLSFNDIQAQKSLPHVFLNSQFNGKGLKIELYETRHFKITMNGNYTYFSIPGNTAEIESGKWHGLFINFGNTFKQMTLNVWKMQWDPVSKFPATTDLKLIYNKTVPLAKIDISSGVAYFLEPSYMDLTNIRLFNRVAETDKQVNILNQNVVKDAQWAIIIDNALPQSRQPYISYTR